ncbi:hypothetical protein C5469_00305 [Photorhabdus cinerea]|uniref:Uncharacterized protein n=1 Tax=Photorhabdus cinerea TaxID=471575 RepID=A0A7X5QAC7_9GAMM|nr:hypothetical protein [Photorhabdus cinerea]
MGKLPLYYRSLTGLVLLAISTRAQASMPVSPVDQDTITVGKPLIHPAHLKPDNWVTYWSASLTL